MAIRIILELIVLLLFIAGILSISGIYTFHHVRVFKRWLQRTNAQLVQADAQFRCKKHGAFPQEQLVISEDGKLVCPKCYQILVEKEMVK